MTPLLRIENLTTVFETDRGRVKAVDNVSFDVESGKTLAVVGESGSGKSVTALSIMRLVTAPGRISAGKISFEGRDLLALSERDMQRVRGDRIAMIFQEPMNSLNPVYTVGSQIVEAIRIHQSVSRRAARARALELLGLVGIPAPAERLDSYPHQLSGGMRQRVMIAMALSCDPALLIADEPTTALDVTIQAQILDLLRRLQDRLGMSLLFITHDLGVVAELASSVVVLYAGQVVEAAPSEELFRNPLHPYTRGLLASVPPLGGERDSVRPRRLPSIEGIVPDLRFLPAGCRFAERCALYATRPPGHERCTSREPELSSAAPARLARCFYSGGTP